MRRREPEESNPCSFSAVSVASPRHAEGIPICLNGVQFPEPCARPFLAGPPLRVGKSDPNISDKGAAGHSAMEGAPDLELEGDPSARRYLQATLSSSSHVPAKHSENVSHVPPEHGCPSGTTIGQVPADGPPSTGGLGRPLPMLLQIPTRQRTASPQASPGFTQVIDTHCPDAEHPNPGLQSRSREHYAPGAPLAQMAAPGDPTHPRGAKHPPGSPGDPSPHGVPIVPSGVHVAV